MKKHLLICLCIAGFSSCSVRKIAAPTAAISGVKFISVYELPHDMPFKGTTVGGLSGIDYNSNTKLYYMICDDRSAINPARYYTAEIHFTEKGIDSVMMKDVVTLLQPNGTVYPNNKQDRYHVPDPEAMRFNQRTNTLVWSSEGERIVKEKDTILENPAITEIAVDGKFIDTFPLPYNLYMHAIESGPRQNGVLEGLTFADDYRTLYVNVEEPLYQDGPRADLTDNNPFIRIYRFDTKTKRNTAQYAYKLDPVAYPAVPANEFKINGVPDILWLHDQKLLVMERSFSTGKAACTIKIYIADLSSATNIKDIASLKNNASFQPVSKKLLLNMDELGIYVDNVEGMTIGPSLPNGHQTLLLVADNNFSKEEKTQFFLFEIIP